MGPLNYLLDPLAYPFMAYGVLEVLLLSVASGLVGVFVIHRDLTFFTHALSHTIFPALVVAALLRINPAVGAAAGATLTLLLVLGLRRVSAGVGEDSAVGIVFTALFAIGVVLVSGLRLRSRDLGAVMVGNVLGLGRRDLALGAALVLCLVVGVTLLYRPLVFATFDRLGAQAQGLPLAWLDVALLSMVAGTAVVSVSVVGVILTVAVLVTPAATARLGGGGLRKSMILAAGLGAAAGVVGLYVAYYVPIAPAAMVVLVLSLFFVISTVTAPGFSRRRAGLMNRPN